MKRVMVRCKVKADRAEENEQYVRKVFDELHQSTPDGASGMPRLNSRMEYRSCILLRLKQMGRTRLR